MALRMNNENVEKSEESKCFSRIVRKIVQFKIREFNDPSESSRQRNFRAANLREQVMAIAKGCYQKTNNNNLREATSCLLNRILKSKNQQQ
jgi:hypothetical protein